jgi:gliding motility-associated protein GldL
MGLYQIVRTRGYRNFMAKLYGIGASVVIFGALFKINHYPGADIMLIIGLGTESIIFFFSAFEPPHVEPDWSLVYPQLAGIYHSDEVDKKDLQEGEGVIKELDKMLEDAKIGPELIQSLGDGMRKLTDTTSQLNDVSNAVKANNQFTASLETASKSATVLSDSYKKSATAIEQNVTVANEQIQSFQAVSKNAAALSSAYSQVSESMKEEIATGKAYVTSMKSAADTAGTFVQKYTQSAELLAKSTEALNVTATESGHYNKQLQKVSQNLSALNALYELHLQSSNEQMQVTTKASKTLNDLVVNVNESAINTGKFKDTVAALNKVFEQQLQGSAQQAESSKKMQDTVQKFISNLTESVDKTAKFKEEVDQLAKNISALNKVYGSMLSAMNVNIK